MLRSRVDYRSFCGDMAMLLQSHGVSLSAMSDRKREKAKARLERYMISCAGRPYSKACKLRIKPITLAIKGIDEAAHLYRLL